MGEPWLPHRLFFLFRYEDLPLFTSITLRKRIVISKKMVCKERSLCFHSISQEVTKHCIYTGRINRYILYLLNMFLACKKRKPHLNAPPKREVQESITHTHLDGCSCPPLALNWELSNQRTLSVTTLCSAPPAHTELSGCGGDRCSWHHSPSATLWGWASCWSGICAEPNIIVGIPVEPQSAMWRQPAMAGAWVQK